MEKSLWTFAVSLCHILTAYSAFGQLGPGGVSNDSGSDSDNSIWFDATELLQSGAIDGLEINTINDISPSANNNAGNAAPGTGPEFITNAINGRPALEFNTGEALLINSSPDVNTGGPYDAKTTLVVFETGNDITTRQVLFEEGGTVRGYLIYIFNGDLFLATYNEVTTDGPGDEWDFSYTRVPVAINSTYILTFEFSGEKANDTYDGSLSGFLNGNTLSVADASTTGNVEAELTDQFNPDGIGLLYSHGNPPGFGNVNGDTFFEGPNATNAAQRDGNEGSQNGVGGNFPFLGQMAEFIQYNAVLDEADRIIVENYLAAKYGDGLLTLAGTDRYGHNVSYPGEVIGIGQFTTDVHLNSQGRNPFSITASDIDENDEFLLIGHNEAALVYTSAGAPEGVEIFERVWRVDITDGGTADGLGDVTFTIDLTDFSEFTVDATFDRRVIVINDNNTVTVDFTDEPNTRVVEMEETGVGTGIYTATANIPDNAYITFGRVAPQVRFELTGSNLFETDADQAYSIDVELNYEPILSTGPISVDFSFGSDPDPTAIDVNTLPATIDFIAGQFETTLDVNVVGDMVEEAAQQSFVFTLQNGGSAPAFLDVGTNATHELDIFDDDLVPQVGFNALTISVAENVTSVSLQVDYNGAVGGLSLGDPIQITYTAINITALDGADYDFSGVSPASINFSAGTIASQNFTIPITNESIFENDESFRVELSITTPASGVGFATGANAATVTITNDDNIPSVEFFAATSSGSELVTTPTLTVQLSNESVNDVQLDLEVAGSATLNTDYTLSALGSAAITVPAGVTSVTLPGFVVNQGDAAGEADETVEFTISNPSGATLGTITLLTYTITDDSFTPFNPTGSAGVGTIADNILYFRADMETSGSITTITDQSNNGNNGLTGTATVATVAALNDQSAFSITDGFEITNRPTLNDGNQFEKHFFIVLQTGALPTGTGSEQFIFEQGGGTNGINLYLDASGNLVFYVYENCSGGTCYEAITRSTTPLSANTAYLITAVFDAVVGSGNPVTRLYLNGALQAEVNLTGTLLETSGLASHTGNVVFGASGGSQLTGNSDVAAGFTFNGLLAEMVYYNQGIEIINTARRRILESSLASKYGITLDFNGNGMVDAGVDDLFSFANSHPKDIIGIGKISDADESHREAQGLNPFNIQFSNVAAVNDNEFIMIGHDGISLAAERESVNIPTAMTMSGGVSAAFDNRLSRTYCSAITGTPGNVDLLFDLSAFTVEDPDDVQLVFDDDGDFTDATIFMEPTTTTVFAGNTFVGFDNVSLADGEFFTIASVSAATILPVELTSFNGISEGSVINLEWATAQESNNDYFEVQRSIDGESFEIIGQLEGAGTLSEGTEYQFVDRNPSHGINYYRLNQVDFDGEKELSVVIAVNHEFPESRFEAFVFPNPSRIEEMRLELATGDLTSPVELILIGSNGEKVASRTFNVSANRTNYGLFDELGMAPGIYHLVIKQSSSISMIKLLNSN